jgi:hypothetical protein
MNSDAASRRQPPLARGLWIPGKPKFTGDLESVSTNAHCAGRFHCRGAAARLHYSFVPGVRKTWQDDKALCSSAHLYEKLMNHIGITKMLGGSIVPQSDVGMLLRSSFCRPGGATFHYAAF